MVNINEDATKLSDWLTSLSNREQAQFAGVALLWLSVVARGVESDQDTAGPANTVKRLVAVNEMVQLFAGQLVHLLATEPGHLRDNLIQRTVKLASESGLEQEVLWALDHARRATHEP